VKSDIPNRLAAKWGWRLGDGLWGGGLRGVCWGGGDGWGGGGGFVVGGELRIRQFGNVLDPAFLTKKESECSLRGHLNRYGGRSRLRSSEIWEEYQELLPSGKTKCVKTNVTKGMRRERKDRFSQTLPG